jgi:hypothetical protein
MSGENPFPGDLFCATWAFAISNSLWTQAGQFVTWYRPSHVLFCVLLYLHIDNSQNRKLAILLFANGSWQILIIIWLQKSPCLFYFLSFLTDKSWHKNFIEKNIKEKANKNFKSSQSLS